MEKMKKIDITKWKKFSLTELFELSLSKGDNQAKKLKEGDIPLVSSGKNNNGICKYIDKGDGVAELFEANTITIDMFGKSFYQPNSYYAVSHGRVNILLPKFKLTPNIGLFFVSIFDASYGKKYSFSGMCNQTELMKEIVYLPVTEDGYPNWIFMERYIKKRCKVVGGYLDILYPFNTSL